YLTAYKCDLFISADEPEVTGALEAGYGAALVREPDAQAAAESGEVRILFDGDTGLFASPSEVMSRSRGGLPTGDAPFKEFLEAMNRVQGKFPAGACP